MSNVDYKSRLEEIQDLASALADRTIELQEAAALDAGFPVKITSVEVELAVEYLQTMEKEIEWLENGQPYGTVAAIFPYDAPSVMLARLGGSALLTGNRLRFSFSSQTPRTAALIAAMSKPFETFEPVMGKHLLYVGSTQGLYALDPDTGQQVWRIEASRTLCSPTVAQQIYAGSLHGVLYSIKPANGNINWRQQFSGWIYSPVVQPEIGRAHV